MSTLKPNKTENNTVKVVGWKFNELSKYVVISLFIFCLLVVKLVHKKSSLYKFLPESLVLLIVGALFGLLIRFVLRKHMSLKFKADMFFYILLPPIILDSSYALATKSFGRVLHFILLFAILGTVINFVVIGFSLHFVNEFRIFGFQSINVSLKSLLLFASLIVAVDPVAVLAIFADIGVELDLYFIVFGESLFNDAVTVVLYDIIKVFIELKSISSVNYVLGIVSFLTVSFGGLVIGVTFGVFTSLLTRVNNPYEVVIVLLFGYLAYLFASLLAWSGIISLIGCGLVQAWHAFHNITRESLMTLRKVISLWCSISEGIIFLFLGESIAHLPLGWHTGFILWSLFLCLLTRFLVVLVFCLIINLVNRDSGRQISLNEQIILAYSGLRGAVAFSLAIMIDDEIVGGRENKEMFLCAALFIIIFTVGFQGLTMKPLVKYLKIQASPTKKCNLFTTTNDSVIEGSMSGLESIVGGIGHTSLIQWLLRIHNRRLKPILQKHHLTADEMIVLNFRKMCANIIDSSPIASDRNSDNCSQCNKISTKNEPPVVEPVILTSDQYAHIVTDSYKTHLINARESNNPVLLINQLNDVYRIKKFSTIIREVDVDDILTLPDSLIYPL